MKLVFASISFFTITLFATAGMAQNQLSVQDQLQAIMDRFPGGGMKVQPAVIRYEGSEMSRQASEAGEPCLECMGVKRIEVKQIGAEDTRTVPTGIDESESSGVGLIVCQNPNVNGGRRVRASGSITGNNGVVVTAAHAFLPVVPRGNGFQAIGKYNFQQDCTFNIYRKVNGVVRSVFSSPFLSGVTGDYTISNPDVGEDWAVMRLARRPGQSLGIQPLLATRMSFEQLSSGIKTRHFSYSHLGDVIVNI